MSGGESKRGSGRGNCDDVIQRHWESPPPPWKKTAAASAPGTVTLTKLQAAVLKPRGQRGERRAERHTSTMMAPQQLRQRAHVLAELLATEVGYVNSIRECVNVFPPSTILAALRDDPASAVSLRCQ